MLYTDLVQFTSLAATLSPQLLFKYLSSLYGKFDALLHQDKYKDITKIDTVGNFIFLAFVGCVCLILSRVCVRVRACVCL